MAGTVLKYGRPVTGPEADIGYIGNGYQRACVYDAHTGTVIVYALGAWVGEWSGGTPYARIVMADVNTGDVPGDILAQTGEFQPSAAYSDITGGDDYVQNVTPFVHASSRFSLALTARNGYVAHSMRQASAISATNRNFYDKAVSGTTPTNPLGGSASYQGHMSLWFVAEPSVAPNTPTNLSPSGSSASTDLTPTLTSSFSDANEVLNNGVAYDYLNQYEIKVTRTSDNVVMWNPTYTASTSERSNRATSRDYAGTALAYNTTYTYAIRHKDRDGNWSGWASTTFSITSLSTVDQPSNPSGFEANKADPGAITAVYRHNAGLSANAMEARLLSSGGTVLATSATKAVTVAPNGTLSMTWAESGFGTSTVNGGSYQVQVRARDTNNQWSPSWSPAQSFRFNAAPNIPTSLSPAGGTASSAYPLLTASASDPDPEHPASGLTVKARIKDSGGTVLQTRTMTWSTTNSRFEYQTTSADLASYATYKWDAYSYDGALYSGGTTAEASASTSAEATFVYAAGPAVTITGPAATVSTITPEVTWTATYTGGATQASYRVRGYRPSDDALVYDSGTIAGAATSHTIASGGWISEAWNNGETFDWIVSVTDTNSLTGDSTALAVTVTYAEPATLTLAAFPVALDDTPGTNAVRLEWQMSGVATDRFSDYEISRVEMLPDEITEKPGTRIVLARVTDPTQTELLDAEVTSKALYRYELRHRVQEGNDLLASSPTMVTASVQWDGLILHMPFDPEGHHVAMRYGDPVYAPVTTFGQAMNLVSPVGAGGRVAFFAPGQTHDPSGTFSLLDVDGTTSQARFDALYAIWQAQGGGEDGLPHVVCWRDGRGGPGSRVYGVINPDWSRGHAAAGRYVIDISMAETAFTLGVSE